MTSAPFNKLAPDEAERLALLAEEMGEAIQSIGKILRHGYESVDPTWSGPEDERPLTNREMLEKEMGDVTAALRIMETFDISAQAIKNRRKHKLQSVTRWMHHQIAMDLVKP